MNTRAVPDDEFPSQLISPVAGYSINGDLTQLMQLSGHGDARPMSSCRMGNRSYRDGG
jgi:hypothetical protein